MTDTVEKFLNRILKACEGERYLFRGTTKSHEEINSSLYRWAVKKEVKFHEKYRPFNIEEEILERAKRLFADSASKIEVLTDSQHFHGKTNLIDFSRNLYIALFFACDGEHHEDGELILLDSAMIGKERQEIDYTELQSSSYPFPIEPANTQISQKRVTSQSSVFVYPPSGYINKDSCKIIPVPAKLKRPVLDHLREVHNIHTGTIYNDLIGFIANEKNYETVAVLFYQGLASDNKGEYEEAIKKYDKAIELNSNYAEIYNNRGVVKNKLRKYQEAIADYNKAIELNPNYVEAYNNRGNAKKDLGQHQEAIADYDKAIELNPDFAGAYSNRGATKSNWGQHQEAIADHDKAVELDQNDAIAYNNRGIAKSKLGQYQEAIDDFNKAIELDLNYAEAYNNRGFAKDELGQHQEAIADYDKAIELNPNYAGIYNNRGIAKSNLGQHQEAIADYDKAIELKPNYADAYKLRGLAYQALGRNQDADEDFKMADKLKSDEAS